MGAKDRHHVTPTPYPAEETVSCLYLPKVSVRRPFVLILDPRRIDWVWGPHWVRYGSAIEYILPGGFPKEAIVGGWEMEVG